MPDRCPLCPTGKTVLMPARYQLFANPRKPRVGGNGNGSNKVGCSLPTEPEVGAGREDESVNDVISTRL